MNSTPSEQLPPWLVKQPVDAAAEIARAMTLAPRPVDTAGIDPDLVFVRAIITLVLEGCSRSDFHTELAPQGYFDQEKVTDVLLELVKRGAVGRAS